MYNSKHPRTIIDEIDAPFNELWEKSGVKDAYLEWVNEKIHQLVENLNSYDPYIISLDEYQASIQMMAYTTTELLAQFCAGGFRWISSDKARFLSPIVDLEKIIRDKALKFQGLGPYFESVKIGVWDFLEVSEYTKSWIEAQRLSKRQRTYLLWSAKYALNLLRANERVEGFIELAFKNDDVLSGYIECESPIESILYMQLVVENLHPPTLVNQHKIGKYRVDFAIPQSSLIIECDGKKYHEAISDKERDNALAQEGWDVIRFSTDDIVKDPQYCAEKIHDIYPWKIIQAQANENN